MGLARSLRSSARTEHRSPSGTCSAIPPFFPTRRQMRMATLPATTQGAEASPIVSAHTRPTARWYQLREEATPYLLIAPLIALVLLFIYWPLVYQTYLSFFDCNLLRADMTWVGLDTYMQLARDT